MESEAILIARRAPHGHANGAPGTWWTEYRVRALSDQEREALPWHFTSHGVPTHALEHRYCHEANSEYCTHHDGEWKVWDYGHSPEEAALSCRGDSHYFEAETLHPLHALMIEHVKADRARWARAAEIRRETHHEWRERHTGIVHAEEINVEADERERAQRDFESALKRARLWSKVQTDSAPQAKVDEIRASVRAAYVARLTERKARHDALMAELTTLEGRDNRASE
jgi:hypothetical protein